MIQPKILLIDDHADFLLMLSVLLERNGYSVITAANGKEGLREAHSNDLDLIITDILMPEQDGLELMTALRSENNETPIIATSGGEKIDLGVCPHTAKLMGAKRIFEKPFDNKEFLSAVDEVISSNDC